MANRAPNRATNRIAARVWRYRTTAQVVRGIAYEGRRRRRGLSDLTLRTCLSLAVGGAPTERETVCAAAYAVLHTDVAGDAVVILIVTLLVVDIAWIPVLVGAESGANRAVGVARDRAFLVAPVAGGSGLAHRIAYRAARSQGGARQRGGWAAPDIHRRGPVRRPIRRRRILPYDGRKGCSRAPHHQGRQGEKIDTGFLHGRLLVEPQFYG